MATRASIQRAFSESLQPSGGVALRGGTVRRSVSSPTRAQADATITSRIDWGGLGRGILDWAGGVADDYVRDRLADPGRRGEQEAACAGLGLILDPVTNRCVGGDTNFSNGSGQASPCPAPMILDQSGICVHPGSPGDMSTGLQAVQGRFGPAYTPAIVGEIRGRPVRKCLAGMVLGRDNLCYERKTLDADERKWRKRSKPVVSAYDAKMMRKYGRGGAKAKAAAKHAETAGYKCELRKGK